MAQVEQLAFFARNPSKARPYANRFIAAALCQGAALHFLDGKCGVKDFDIHLFYIQHPRYRQLSRTVKSFPEKVPDFGVRRLDFIRSVVPARIVDANKPNVTNILRRFLGERPTSNSKYLAEKAVVGLLPERIFGKVIWPIDDVDAS